MSYRNNPPSMWFKHCHNVYPLLATRGAMKLNKDYTYSMSVLADHGMSWTKLPIGHHNEEFLVKVLSKFEADTLRQETRAGLVYRVIVLCRCGCEMPLAKIGQHIATKACKRNAKKNGVTWLVPA